LKYDCREAIEKVEQKKNQKNANITVTKSQCRNKTIKENIYKVKVDKETTTNSKRKRKHIHSEIVSDLLQIEVLGDLYKNLIAA
jgi:hypothetical protein